MTRWATLPVLALIAAGACYAREDAKKAFKAYVVQVAAKEQNAYAQKNSAFFEKLYAPTFQTVDEHGVKNGKKVAIYLLRYHFNMLKDVKFSTKLLSLDASGNTGTVRLMTVLQGQTIGHHGTQGGPIKITRIEKEVFVKNGNEWQMSLDQDLKAPVLLQPAMANVTALKPARSKG